MHSQTPGLLTLADTTQPPRPRPRPPHDAWRSGPVTTHVSLPRKSARMKTRRAPDWVTPPQWRRLLTADCCRLAHLSKEQPEGWFLMGLGQMWRRASLVQAVSANEWASLTQIRGQ